MADFKEVLMDSRPRNPEDMRKAVLDGIDWALTAPLFCRFLGQDAKDALHAQYSFWQTADAATLERLYALYAERRTASPQPPAPDDPPQAVS